MKEVSDRQVGDVRGNDMAAPMAMTLTLTGVSPSKTKVKPIHVKLVLCLNPTPFHSLFFSLMQFMVPLTSSSDNQCSFSPQGINLKVIFSYFNQPGILLN